MGSKSSKNLRPTVSGLGVGVASGAIVKVLIPTAIGGQAVTEILTQAAPQIGLAAIAGASAGALLRGGHWFFTDGLSRLNPKKRFAGMADDLDAVLRQEVGHRLAESGTIPPSLDPEDVVRHHLECVEMRWFLTKLRIGGPGVPRGFEPGDRGSWLDFVGSLVPLARVGDLNKARKRWPPAPSG